MSRRAAAFLCGLLAALALLTPPARAAGLVDLSRTVTLDIAYLDEGKPLVGVPIDIYLVALMDESGELTVTEEFAPYFEQYNLTLSLDTWKTLASTLKGPVLLDGLAPTDSGVTDQDGRLRFPCQRERLEKGLYLVMGGAHKQDGRIYESTPFVVMLPEPEEAEDGAVAWSYGVDVVMKFLSRTDTAEGGTIERKVLKVWADNGYANERPQEITVHLLKDGEIYDTVTLNAETNWRYDWPELDRSSEWTVVEAGAGRYTVSVSQEGITFVVTNSYEEPPPPPPDNPPPPYEPEEPPDEPPPPYEPEEPHEDIPDEPTPTTELEPPPEEPEPPVEPEWEEIPPEDVPLANLPQTGQLWWPAPAMLAGGLLLIILGLLRRRGSQYED